MVLKSPHFILVSVWFCVLCARREGHTSLVQELQVELIEKPGAVVLSVGGGGLLCGVVQGLRRAGWGDVPIIAMETVGAHSLNAAMEMGELVTLPKITRYHPSGPQEVEQSLGYFSNNY